VPQVEALHVAVPPVGAGHAFVQLPQWLTSVAVFAQVEPQRVGVPAEQPDVHE
jgi:hypothetical protein